jgi:hypothetical protein
VTQEVRYILFSPVETVWALALWRAATDRPLAPSTVETFAPETGPDGPTLRLTAQPRAGGAVVDYRFETAELTDALIHFCAGRRIPLPKDAAKELELHNGRLAIRVRRNLDETAGQIGGDGVGLEVPDIEIDRVLADL